METGLGGMEHSLRTPTGWQSEQCGHDVYCRAPPRNHVGSKLMERSQVRADATKQGKLASGAGVKLSSATSSHASLSSGFASLGPCLSTCRMTSEQNLPPGASGLGNSEGSRMSCPAQVPGPLGTDLQGRIATDPARGQGRPSTNHLPSPRVGSVPCCAF